MTKYEAIIILDPNLTKEEVKQTVKSYTLALEAMSPKVVHCEEWGTKKLAYPITVGKKKYNMGTYLLFNFWAPESKSKGGHYYIDALSTVLHSDGRVIKHVCVKHDTELGEYDYEQNRKESLPNWVQDILGTETDPANILKQILAVQILGSEQPDDQSKSKPTDIFDLIYGL